MVFDGGAAVKVESLQGLPPATRSRRCVQCNRWPWFLTAVLL